MTTNITKICAKCKKRKSLDKFSDSIRYKDGKHSYCRECDDKRVKEYYKNNAKKVYLSFRKWQSINGDKRTAHTKVGYAIKSGKLIRPKRCEICGKTGRIEAHHWHGYSEENVLDVQWVCVSCHRKM